MKSNTRDELDHDGGAGPKIARNPVMLVDADKPRLARTRAALPDDLDLMTESSETGALQMLATVRVAAIVVSQNVYRRAGSRFLEHLATFHPEVERIVSCPRIDVAMVKPGIAIRCLAEPVDVRELEHSLRAAIRRASLAERARKLAKRLEEEGDGRAAAQRRSDLLVDLKEAIERVDEGCRALERLWEQGADSASQLRQLLAVAKDQVGACADHIRTLHRRAQSIAPDHAASTEQAPVSALMIVDRVRRMYASPESGRARVVSSAAPDIWIQADATDTARILVNLISHSLTDAQEAGVRVDVGTVGDRVRFRVWGLGRQTASRAWDRRISMVRRAAEENGGALREAVGMEPGTVFDLELPSARTMAVRASRPLDVSHEARQETAVL